MSTIPDMDALLDQLEANEASSHCVEDVYKKTVEAFPKSSSSPIHKVLLNSVIDDRIRNDSTEKKCIAFIDDIDKTIIDKENKCCKNEQEGNPCLVDENISPVMQCNSNGEIVFANDVKIDAENDEVLNKEKINEKNNQMSNIFDEIHMNSKSKSEIQNFFREQPDIFTNMRLNLPKTNFDEVCNEPASELDHMASEYAEMEKYLSQYEIESIVPKFDGHFTLSIPPALSGSASTTKFDQLDYTIKCSKNSNMEGSRDIYNKDLATEFLVPANNELVYWTCKYSQEDMMEKNGGIGNEDILVYTKDLSSTINGSCDGFEVTKKEVCTGLENVNSSVKSISSEKSYFENSVISAGDKFSEQILDQEIMAKGYSMEHKPDVSNISNTVITSNQIAIVNDSQIVHRNEVENTAINQITDVNDSQNIHSDAVSENSSSNNEKEEKSLEQNSKSSNDESSDEETEDENGERSAKINREKSHQRERMASVVTITYNLAEPNIARLTESELQLGKVKPVWIADSETASCMLCCAKFTLILRRHHCRCCGRVLCAYCTSHKAVLPYMNDLKKKFRICEPCLNTLRRIEEYEKEQTNLKSFRIIESADSQSSSSNPSNTSNQGIIKNTKSLLKQQSDVVTENLKNEERPEDGALTNELNKRSVKFLDGVSPGEDQDGHDDAYMVSDANATPFRPKKSRHPLRRSAASRRIKQMHVEEEIMCYLPKHSAESFYTRTEDGAIINLDQNMQQMSQHLSDFSQLDIVIYRSFSCSVKVCKSGENKVMCVITRGMADLGLDEIFIAHYLEDNEVITLPVNIIKRLQEIYDYSIAPQDGTVEETMLGMRFSSIRTPFIQRSDISEQLDEFTARTILLHRPNKQQFNDLIVPFAPFLVATFIYQSEMQCALALPQRLLYRIGLQASYYPTPIVNRKNREPVYDDDVGSSVLKVFNDFRNWTYRMPMIYGSYISLEDNNTTLFLPKNAVNQLNDLAKISGNMVAWSLDFNISADSHLVCDKDNQGSYRTQIFTSGINQRKVTGASFVIFDGALKDTNSALSVKVIEDGVTIRLHMDMMASLLEALRSGVNFALEFPNIKFSVEWIDIPVNHTIGELISPIDSISLMGKYQYGIIKTRALSSLHNIPSTDWSLRLASIFNINEGKVPAALHSKMFSICDEITSQVAQTLTPFVCFLVREKIWYLHFRIRLTPDEANYFTALWPEVAKQEYATWIEVLDYQFIPVMYSLCSFISTELNFELIFSIQSSRPVLI